MENERCILDFFIWKRTLFGMVVWCYDGEWTVRVNNHLKHKERKKTERGMNGGRGEEGDNLDFTPTWVLTTVCKTTLPKSTFHRASCATCFRVASTSPPTMNLISRLFISPKHPNVFLCHYRGTRAASLQCRD